MVRLEILISGLALVKTCLALPVQEIAQIKRGVEAVNDEYDYVIIGGGTAGLAVGERLSEDGSKTVLVVEYGYIDNDPGILLPSKGVENQAILFNYTSVPQKELNNAITTVYAAAVVGGGSTANHMMFDRGSAEDYDNWGKLQNPGWDFNGLLPYFKKSSTFTPPSEELQEEFGYTYELGAYGDGHIQASYPPYQFPSQKLQWNAWLDLGINVSKEGAGGDAFGLFWIPTNADPKTETRSYAVNGYDAQAEPRKNYHLLPGYKVREILFDGLTASGITFEPRSGTNKTITTVKAKQEVILAAGAFNSPVILQRSGVGPKDLLMSAGIDVKLDLPGVGQNLQDHAATLIDYAYATDLQPNTLTAANNATFAAAAQAEYDLNKTGPLTVGLGNSVVFLPLSDFHTDIEGLIATIEAQKSSDYLPSDYGPTALAGFEAQKKILVNSYRSKKSAMLEMFFNGDPVNVVVLEKPLSRGTVKLNTTDPLGDPVVDPNTFVNPVDLDIDLAMMRFARKWYAAPSMASLSPIELVPGVNVTSDADLTAAVRQFSIPSIGHGMGTAAMMPLELGGVVGTDLLVYGVKGLSIVDASIIPLAPATHTCSTVYAIAEKAAELIKSRAKY